MIILPLKKTKTLCISIANNRVIARRWVQFVLTAYAFVPLPMDIMTAAMGLVCPAAVVDAVLEPAATWVMQARGATPAESITPVSIHILPIPTNVYTMVVAMAVVDAASELAATWATMALGATLVENTIPVNILILLIPTNAYTMAVVAVVVVATAAVAQAMGAVAVAAPAIAMNG